MPEPRVFYAVKPSKPRCWMEGRLLEGSDVKMSCKSADGSDPIHYKWEKVLDKGRYVGKLPPLALLGTSLQVATAVGEWSHAVSLDITDVFYITRIFIF